MRNFVVQMRSFESWGDGIFGRMQHQAHSRKVNRQVKTMLDVDRVVSSCVPSSSSTGARNDNPITAEEQERDLDIFIDCHAIKKNAG